MAGAEPSTQTKPNSAHSAGFLADTRPPDPASDPAAATWQAFTADEAFITSTSWCICGVRVFNGRQVGGSTEASPHGPVTRRLMDAYVELVQCDFVKQYTDAH